MAAAKLEMDQGKMAQHRSDWWEVMRRADEHIGKTAKDKLDWVLRFAKTEISGGRPEERAQLGFDLRALQNHERWHGPPLSLVMPDRMVRAIHRAIRSGLTALFSEGPDNQWSFPAPKSFMLHRMNPLASKQTRFQRYYTGGDEKAVTLGTIYDLLIECQQTLRACERCRQPFVRVRKQKFCSEECGQAERNFRKKVIGKR